MSIDVTRALRLLAAVFGLTLAMILAPAAFGQAGAPAPNNRTLAQVNARPVPVGAKVKFRGGVVRRDADTFIIRDASRNDTQVLLTDETSIKTHRRGLFKGAKSYAVTDILTGLIVEVEGRGDRQGQLVADKIRFNESDMRAAITTETRVGPVEENQLRLSGQIDELSAVADEARREAAAAQQTADLANERISSLDDYDVQDEAVVNFALNSASLSAEARRQLDGLAAKANAARGFVIEVSGHADATGSASRNFQLSQRRAEAVVQYLAVNHHVPMRRFITPMGYGKTASVADNTTAAGRAQNRRVEVKVLVNRGMSRPAARDSARNP
ncbi:MAG TPA: OmpA family protein [Pyrinomonadaceae bacterium]|jgi:outer membrane protein OmpA-like peptidoglycan-associated protein